MIIKPIGYTVLAVIALLAFGGTAMAADDAYRTHRGDVLEVNVWREDTLNKQLIVLPDGSVSFPLIGRVLAAGRSVTDLEQEIAEKLMPYISDPVVTVSVIGIDGNRVYVIGKVNNPGSFVMQQPMTVMQLLSVAGGLQRFADSNDIQILRQGDGGSTAIPFSYSPVERGEALETNIVLEPGDVVVVP